VSTVKEVRSVANACRVLEAIARAQPVGVSELARTLEIDKSAVHRLAITLHGEGWLDRRDDGRWSISPALGSRLDAAARLTLIDEIRPLLERARAATGETAMLVVAEGTRLRIIAVAESHHNLRVTATEGVEMPARRSSALRALAAHGEADQLRAWRTIDPDLTDELLEAVRARGWATNDAELIPESRGVAAVVCAADGRPVGALVVCGPSTRFTSAQLTEHGRVVADLADEWSGRA
jgi:IclR family acetate operon transcriptional repressor